MQHTKLLFLALLMFVLTNSFSQTKNTFFDNTIMFTGIDSKLNNTFQLNNHKPIEKFSQVKFNDFFKDNFIVFVVFRSTTDNDVNFLNLKYGKHKLIFKNNAIISNAPLFYKKKRSQGLIVNYSSSIPRKYHYKNTVKFNKKNLKSKNGVDLYEVILYPTKITGLKMKQIQTYLSIKYGISLTPASDYIKSDKVVIWDHKKNKPYNNRLTGLLSDEGFGLKQLESKNAYFNNLKLEIADLSKQDIKDGFYTLFGDNDKKNVFNHKDGTMMQMDRKWLVRTNDNLKKYNMTYIDNDTHAGVVWLVVYHGDVNSKNAKYYQAEKNNNTYLYKNVSLTDNSNFTFIKIPELKIVQNISNANCSNNYKSHLKLKIKNGIAPYQLVIRKDGVVFDTKNSEKNVLIFDDLADGNYTLTITDKLGRTIESVFNIDTEKDYANNIQLNKNWFITENEIELAPNIDKQYENDLLYEWYYQDDLVGSSKNLVVSKPGNYQLIVTNNYGCEKTFSCKVHKSDDSLTGNLVIYPIPTSVNDNLTISLNLDKEQNVSISIYTLTGQLIKNKELGVIKSTVLHQKFPIKGSYFIVIKTDNKTITKKIIIK